MKLRVFLERLNFQILQLALGGATGAVGHQILAFLSLWESDNVPYAFASGQDGHHPVQSKGDPAMGRGSEGKSFEHIAKPAFHDFRGNLKDVFENFFL